MRWFLEVGLVLLPLAGLPPPPTARADAPEQVAAAPATDPSESAALNAVAMPAVAQNVTPEVLYYHPDATGNLVAMTDASGQVAWHADMRPFGQGAANPQDYPLRFLDQPLEASIGAADGLYHLGARAYDPLTGRFLSTDPLPLTEVTLAEPQRFNRYSYALGNPYRYQDASGRDTVVIITRDYTFGSHAAVRIDNNGDPILYDPGGSYEPTGADGQPLRGSNDAFSGNAVDLDAFIKYHESTGSQVEIYRFKTTPEQERQIAERIEKSGGGYRGGLCSIGVCMMLSGIGPFKDLGTHLLPGYLAGDLERLRRQRILEQWRLERGPLPWDYIHRPAKGPLY